MNPTIQKAVKNLKDAEAALRLVLKVEQQACQHPQVIHAKWRSSEWGSPFKAQRLCLCCGLEEDARHSGFGDSDSDFRRLKTKGFHKIVSHDELWRSRFPEADLDEEVEASRRAARSVNDGISEAGK
jgi:hypothetical protein